MAKVTSIAGRVAKKSTRERLEKLHAEVSKKQFPDPVEEAKRKYQQIEKTQIPESWAAKEFPQELGKVIDLLIKEKAKLSALNAKAKEQDKEVTKLEDYLINHFEKEKLDGAKGRLGSVSLAPKDVPQVKDKAAFLRWMAENDAADCLYGRAVEEACNLRWKDGINIPGIEKFHKVNLSVHVNKGK